MFILAHKDIELRVSQDNVSSSDITKYHLETYEELQLPIYAWIGLFLTNINEDVWRTDLSNDFTFKKTLTGFENFAPKHRDYSLPRLADSIAVVIDCIERNKTAYLEIVTISDAKIYSHDHIAKEWDVEVNQVFRINGNEVLIISKPRAIVEEVLEKQMNILNKHLTALQVEENRLRAGKFIIDQAYEAYSDNAC